VCRGGTLQSPLDRGEQGRQCSGEAEAPAEQQLVRPDDGKGSFPKAYSGPLALLLKLSEGIGFAELSPPHQDPLGLLHPVSDLQGLIEITRLFADEIELSKPGPRFLDGPGEPPALHRSHQIGHDPGLAGSLDEIGGGVGGEKDEGHRPLGENRPGSFDPIQDREVRAQEDELWLQSGSADQGLPTVSGQPYDGVAEAFELDREALRGSALVFGE
jgi:hypothetical protein